MRSLRGQPGVLGRARETPRLQAGLSAAGARLDFVGLSRGGWVVFVKQENG